MEKKIKRQLDELKRFTHLSPDYYHFYKKLLYAQSKSLKLLNRKKIREEIHKSSPGEKINNNIPILDINRLEFDPNYLKALYKDLVDILLDYNNHQTDEINSKKNRMLSSKLDVNRLIPEYVNNNIDFFNHLQTEEGIDGELYIFLSQMLGRPVLGIYSEIIQQQFSELSSKNGRCPVCGRKADMARLENDSGKRILWCSLCNTEYYFDRIKCIDCHSDDQKNLKYFYLDKNSPYRVDVCENCLVYIKTIDERRCGDRKTFLMYIEDTGTIDLDILAEKEGYKRVYSHFNV